MSINPTIKFFLVGIFISIALFVRATPYFEYTPEAKQAYQKALSLRFEEARHILDWIKTNEPDNRVVYHIENYIDFFTIFINEEEEEFKRLEKNKSYRLKKIQEGSKDSPYYLYIQAEMRLQWALARLKFEEYVVAFNEVSKAYKQLKENQKKFPNFIANQKSLGILHALIGTIPDNYQWGVKILGGMSGSIEQGRAEIEDVLTYAKNNDFLFEQETIVMYAWLLLHLKNQEDQAWQIVQKAHLQPTKNPLACFTLANVAMRTGRNDTAIHILENRPQGSVFHDFYYLDYMLGLAKLYRLDLDANYYIENYINYYKGQNYIKEAHQKLAWFYLLKGNLATYHDNMRHCQTRGVAIIDGDKTALQEANKGTIPNKILLKARLLFDGGYYHKAYTFLKETSKNNFSNNRYQLEYTYRLGRISHKLRKYEEALDYYNYTIEEGKNERFFYACNAALQMGNIYEKLLLYSKADEYYKICLSLTPDEYRSSLHQKAKAGRNRLKVYNY